MFCSKCGKPIEDDVQYCPFCGSKVNVEWEEKQEISYKKKNDYKHSNGIFSKLMVIVGVFALGIIIITGGFLFLNYKTNNKGDAVNLYEVVEGEGMSRYEWIKLLCENFHVNQFEKSDPYFSDVDRTSEYYPYIQAAVEGGILDRGEFFNGKAAVTGKYAAVTTCKAIGEGTFRIYFGYDGKWTADRYAKAAIELGIINTDQMNQTLLENKCSDLISKAVYVENTELWLDNYVDVKYKKRTYEVDEADIAFITDDCRNIRLLNGKYKKGDSLVFKDTNGLVVIRTIDSVKDDTYVLKDADLDQVLEKYQVSDIYEITLEDIYRSGGWNIESGEISDTSYKMSNYTIVDAADSAGEINLYSSNEVYKVSLEGDESESKADILPMKVTIEGSSGISISRTLSEYYIDKGTSVSIIMKNLTVKYQYDYYGAYSKVVIDCDTTLDGKVKFDKELVNIPLWEPIPNIALGDDTVNVTMGVYLSVNAKGEIGFSFEMPISVGVQKTLLCTMPVFRINDINNPMIYCDGEVFAGPEFITKITLFGMKDNPLMCTIKTGAKAQGSLITRDLDNPSKIISCMDIKLIAPYYAVEADFFGKKSIEFEDGYEIPRSLHIEAYASEDVQIKLVDKCTYKEFAGALGKNENNSTDQFGKAQIDLLEDETVLYGGTIADVVETQTGDYRVWWSLFTVYQPMYISASEVALFHEGLTREFGNSGLAYVCVEGDEADYWYFIPDYCESYSQACQEGEEIYRIPKRTSSAKVRVEYASFVSTDIYEPAMLVEDYQNIETIIDKNAVISYLYDYDHTVESSFEEFYKSGGNSIYFNENSNTWRGFMTMLVNQVKDGKIMKLTEQPLMG